MKSVFDIIGPVMIGPSSSHTAGAVRLGRMARFVLDEEPVQAKITLYGSFAETYKGHGTDKAIAGGLLGMNTDDSGIRNALNIAIDAGLMVEFEMGSSSELHPNTAGIEVLGVSGKNIYVEGSSVGGGNIVINLINDFSVEITGNYPTLIVEHEDKPGVIGKLTSGLGEKGINIATVKMSRKQMGFNQLMVIETDQSLPEEVLKEIKLLPNVASAIKIEPI